jgi:HD-GYP domain-containing protein (c-di-GMP phosphodiesterase class II)
VSRVVRSIHESYDGTGYPDALAGREIPFRSRIIGACSAYIGLTNELPPETALAQLRAAAGTRYDPEVVDALASVVAEPELVLANVG